MSPIQARISIGTPLLISAGDHLATKEAAPAHLAGVHVLPSTALVCAEKDDARGEGTEHR
jgi:hypothetical protein